MKNLFKLSSMMMVVILLVSSCSKNDDEVLEPDQEIEMEITQVEMQNKANPNDDQGLMYIKFLKALEFNGDLGGWDVSQLAEFNDDIGNWDVGQIVENQGLDGWDVSQIIDNAMEFNKNNGKDSGERARQNLAMQIEAISGLGTFNPIDDCLWRPDRCRVTKLALAALDSSNGGTAHDRTIKLINMLRDQEAQIQGDGEMEPAEKNEILISLAIARHAAGYWFNRTRETEVPTYKVTPNMIQLSTIGATTAFRGTGSEEVGVSTAILSAYVASGRAN